MKRQFFARLPSACICFTVITLAVSLINPQSRSLPVFCIQLFCVILGCQAADWLLSFVRFKSRLRYCLAEAALLYADTLAAALLLGWSSPEPLSIAVFTLVFSAAYASVFWYLQYRQKLLADEINRML